MTNTPPLATMNRTWNMWALAGVLTMLRGDQARFEAFVLATCGYSIAVLMESYGVDIEIQMT